MNRTHLAPRLAHATVGLTTAILSCQTALAAVGRTEASYTVSKDGEAVYTIPLGVTEGINGMTPRLAISYAGPDTRTVLGIGFALSGFSYVTPCRKTAVRTI